MRWTKLSSKWSINLTQIICVSVWKGDFSVIQVVATVKLTDVKKITTLTRLSRFEMKINSNIMEIGLAPKRFVPRASLRNASHKGGKALLTSYLNLVASKSRWWHLVQVDR